MSEQVVLCTEAEVIDWAEVDGNVWEETTTIRYRHAGSGREAMWRNRSFARVERDPELPTTPGAVIWGEEKGGTPGAYELMRGHWYQAGFDDETAPERIRVHAVLRDPGAET